MALLRNVELTPYKNLLTDVENRRIYTLNQCELNVFETFRASSQVQLTFNEIVLTSMVRGKKVMYLPDTPSFDYFPGETVLAPAGTKMLIDFPDAEEQTPTQCIALTLDAASVAHTINYLNEQFPRMDAPTGWTFNYHTAHLKNSNALAQVVNKMVTVCMETSATKDILADLTMKELIVRLVQLQNQHEVENTVSLPQSQNRFQSLIKYIREHLHDKLDVDALCKKAYMSRPNFFRLFKREFGISPVQFILKERLKRAKSLLAESGPTIHQVSLEAGFDDVNNFIKAFKREEGLTPGHYRSKLLA